LKGYLIGFIRSNYRNVFTVLLLLVILQLSVRENYLLFHTIVELLSIVVAFAVFMITWNSRKMLDNNYLYFVGIAYIFIGALDLLHTITFKGMQIIPGSAYHANQFWIATRTMEALTLVLGFLFLKMKKTLNADLIILAYLVVTMLIILSILSWDIFPLCYIDGFGQTSFKIFAEYVVILLLCFAGYLLFRFRHNFDKPIFRLLSLSVIFAIFSEFCFTLYISNYSFINALGHYAKLISFFLIYKANVEKGFTKPTGLIFKNLKDNEEKYRTLAENLPEVIIRFDKDFRCLYASTAIEKFLPYGHDFYTGKMLREFGFPLIFEDLLIALLVRVEETKVIQETNLDLTGENNDSYFSLQVIPEYGSYGNEGTFLVICYDITELKVKEKRLQDLNATKDKFFSIIAHDLKNPFTALIAFSELIYKNVNKLSTEKIENLAMRMNDSSKQAFVLLENLLNWSQVQTGALVPNPQVLEAGKILNDNYEQAASLALAKGIKIEIEEPGSGRIFADGHMIDTVLRNLITNAIKFSYSNSTVWLKAEDRQDHIVFSIKDTGLGIEKETMSRLLKMESKLSTKGTREEKGSGLGLILCKEFVELSGGKIWAESELGLGTTFYFAIPSI
jgi:PAS domain S-box-containing protein